MEQKPTEKLIFLNSPIENNDADIIGIKPYVEQLDTAINAGALMIAITSPFGAGKTSIIELLKKERTGQSDERIVKISMWSQLSKFDGKIDSVQLHKTFVYQLASELNPRVGTYINRRMSKNYGLLNLHASRARYWIFTVLALLLVIVSQLIHAFPAFFQSAMPKLAVSSSFLETVLLLLAGLLGVFILTRADILFSSNKSEGARDVEIDEILDLYRTEILRRWHFHHRKYIVVIEDLDRTLEKDAVINFLQVLRRYCIQKNDGGKDRNEVAFLVNIMPEATLFKDVPLSEQESRYAKLFDFILNLQTINVDNYDAVLEGLLDEKKAALQALELPMSETLTEIPGMQWIIREPKVGIREIKERLNKAFLLYRSLRDKFPQKGISFEQCAVVAYLTTAFEADFFRMNDRAFEDLIQLFLKKKTGAEADYAAVLTGCSERYINTVRELIEAKLIDSNYRTYFYNYPKGSHLYSSDESRVLNAILYKEASPELEEISCRVVQQGSNVTEDAFEKLRRLGLGVPDVVLETDTLYTEALQWSFPGVIRRIQNFDYSDSGFEATLRRILTLLHFDAHRRVYGQPHAEKLCKIWETASDLSEDRLQHLRECLCNNFPDEILWYRPLFFGTHPLITAQEIKALPFKDLLQLINLDHDDFSAATVQAVVRRFGKDGAPTDVQPAVEDFLREATDYLEQGDIAPLLMDEMSLAAAIPPDFETIVLDQIPDADENKENGEAGEQLFLSYQQLLNRLAETQTLTAQTLQFIETLRRYDGYSAMVAAQLDAQGRSLPFALITLCLNEPVPFVRAEIAACLKDGLPWLTAHSELFFRLRRAVVEQYTLLPQYAFLFGETCPVMIQEELDKICRSEDSCDRLVMALIPPALVIESTAVMLAAFFSRKNQKNLSYGILLYIAEFKPAAAKACFGAVDFTKIRYRYIASAQRDRVKELMNSALELHTNEGKLHCMERTGFLDNEWEPLLLPTLNEDAAMQERYVALVNRMDKVSSTTAKTVSALSTAHKLSPTVLEALFQQKRYANYVAAKVLNDNRQFVLEESSRGETLWPTYLSIFKSSGWGWLREIMTHNQDFLYRIMREQAYKNMNSENRGQLCSICQDVASLKEAAGRGAEFALPYFLQIGGFQDHDAASTFVDIVKDTPELLASAELYQHIHGEQDMLLDKILKRAYTNARKKAECP